jgi:hypothetical protein
MAGNAPNLQERDPYKIVLAVNELFQGRSHAVGTVTLRANQTTTTVSSDTCGDESVILLSPTTANAAAALATTYVSAVTQGSFTLTHANNAQTDKTFGYVALG